MATQHDNTSVPDRNSESSFNDLQDELETLLTDIHATADLIRLARDGEVLDHTVENVAMRVIRDVEAAKQGLQELARIRATEQRDQRQLELVDTTRGAGNLREAMWTRFEAYRAEGDAMAESEIRRKLAGFQYDILERGEPSYCEDEYIAQHGWSRKGLSYLLALERLHESIMPDEDQEAAA